MKVSIIVPVYNVEQYIVRCFESVKNQTYANIECIFIDDCSPDNSSQILKDLILKYSGPIDFHIITHNRNKGLSEARNTGTKYATGDYIYYLDSDDEITYHCLEELSNLVKQYPKVDLVQGNTRTVPQTDRENDWRDISQKKFPEYVEDSSWIKERCFKQPRIPVNAWNKLIKKDFLIDNNLFFRAGIIHEDVQWMFYVAKYIKSIAFTKKSCYIHYVVSNSIMQSGSRKNSLDSWIKILDDIFLNIDEPHLTLQTKYFYFKLMELMMSLSLKGPYHEYIPRFQVLVKRQLFEAVRQFKIIEILFLLVLILPARIIYFSKASKKVFYKIDGFLAKMI